MRRIKKDVKKIMVKCLTACLLLGVISVSLFNTNQTETKASATILSTSGNGDVNQNGSVDLADAQLTLKAALKITNLNSTQKTIADVDKNGSVELNDAQIILKLALKIISSPDEQTSSAQTMVFEGKMTAEEQADEYQFTAKTAGNYRFDITNDNASAYYAFFVRDSRGSIVKSASSLFHGDGVTANLEKGKTYTIKIVQKYKFSNYKITVGVPKEIRDISGLKAVKDTITYEDQQNVYTYTASVSGNYRFDITDNNASAYYTIFVIDSRDSIVKSASTLYHGDGITAQLEAGQTYTIKMCQKYKFSNYEIKIGVPQVVQDITGQTSVSGRMTYEDQQNVYTYTASASGLHLFTINNNNASSYYSMFIYDERNSIIASASTLYDGDTAKATLTLGKTYTIKLVQKYKFSNYTIKIQKYF